MSSSKTVEVPVSLLRSFARAAEAFTRLQDELEDYLIAQDDALMRRLEDARTDHEAGRVRALADLKQELCIE